MRVETNQKLAQRNKQIAQTLVFFSFAFLIGIFFLANLPLFAPQQQLDMTLYSILPWLILPLGFVPTIISARMTNLWVRPPRPEIVIREGLKGLSNKSVLYNYYHFPARHVLICPQGVFAIITRFQDGSYSVTGDKWTTNLGLWNRVLRTMRTEHIGNPTHDAIVAAEHTKRLIAGIAPNVEVQPLIIFVDPRVQLSITDPVVPVLFPYDNLEPNLKDYLREVKGSRATISNNDLVALVDAFENATLPKDKQKSK
ncbi:MAG: nuclease-related domain-containing protein [Anaerolineae bacterium]